MLGFFELIANTWKDIFQTFDKYPLQIGDNSVSITALLLAFFVIGFFVSFYWKGAKT